MLLLWSLGWMWFHASWFGAVLGLIAVGCLPLMRNRPTPPRYRMLWSSLALWVGFAVFVFAWVFATGSVGNKAVWSGGALDWPRMGDDTGSGPTLTANVLYTLWDLVFAVTADLIIPLTLVAFIIVVILAVRRFGELIRLTSVPLRPAPVCVQAWIDAARSAAGVRRPVRGVIASALSMPCTWGFRAPVIAFPQALIDDFDDRELQLVIQHEMTHVGCGDFLANLILTAVETVFFFHPAMGWLARQIREEQEHRCDDRVLQQTAAPVRYARVLLRIAQSSAHGKQGSVPAVTGGALESRIKRLLQPAESPRRLWRHWATTAAGFILAAIVSWSVFGGGLHSSQGLRSSFLKTQILHLIKQGDGDAFSSFFRHAHQHRLQAARQP